MPNLLPLLGNGETVSASIDRNLSRGDRKMHFSFHRCVLSCIAFALLNFAPDALAAAQKKPEKALEQKEVLAAMRKASDFMMNTVSTRGGFVWNYSADLSERWGEVPARKSQIWVQGATNGVGELFHDAWKTTGDSIYLGYARRVAEAIVWGQHPEGGWHYLIDFDMPGIQKWYNDVGSKCWGWEEYYHYYGNCTFDDETTSSSCQYLLDLYMATLDPVLLTPLMKGLNFVLEAQYPNGGWPQRYPLRYEYTHDGLADYTSYYTFNDGVIPNNIFLLIDAWEKLGDEQYIKAARRGMDFYLLSQGPEEQAGWSAQYNMNIQPAQARSYEPAAWSTQITVGCLRDLEQFYMITGDRRYLCPIPLAIRWLENSIINRDPSKKYTHGRFLEVGTNKPLVAHRKGTTMENGRYWVDYNLENPITHMGMTAQIDCERLKAAYEKVKAMSPQEARASYHARKKRAEKRPASDPETVKKLIQSMDPRGAWVTSITIPNYSDPITSPRRQVQGISTGGFISNMEKLMGYVSEP
ncbi:MAG: pectate lyase [Candidatus Latescibacter sp.]|nr:pectate lyase [Candidatus Latescibacter sp.]